MSPLLTPLHMLLSIFVGWVNRHQLDVIEYFQEENRVLKERLGGHQNAALEWGATESISEIHHDSTRQIDQEKPSCVRSRHQAHQEHETNAPAYNWSQRIPRRPERPRQVGTGRAHIDRRR